MTYTPTTREVRRVYALAPPNLAQCAHTNPNEGYAAEQFDRWLAEELRKAQETAWDQGAMDAAMSLNHGGHNADNPYRSQP